MYIKGIPADRSPDLHIRCDTHSSAAEGIASCRRLGKFKHLETRTPSVQDEVDEGVMLIRNERQQQRQYVGSWCGDFEWVEGTSFSQSVVP